MYPLTSTLVLEEVIDYPFSTPYDGDLDSEARIEELAGIDRRIELLSGTFKRLIYELGRRKNCVSIASSPHRFILEYLF